MYVHTTDKGTVSKCSGVCASAWPKVMSKGKPDPGKDIKGKHLKRNAKGQVTYYGHPLYYFASDTAPGKITGEGLVHFFVVSTSGKVIKKPIKKTKPTTGPTGPAEVTTGMVGKVEVLTTKTGRTLYALDSPTEASKLYCKGACLTNWLPLLTKGAPTAGGDADAGMLATITRSGLGTQVTYNGLPVYSFTGDTAAGQASGEMDFGPLYSVPPYTLQYWYDLTPAGAFHT
jgi:predicted lipoprotein with Yx(FWY)xxD motif